MLRGLVVMATLALLAPLLAQPAEAATKTKLLLNLSFTGKAGTRPDKKIFTYDYFPGGNAESQWYTNRPRNVSLDGTGSLAFHADRIPSADFPDTDFAARDRGANFTGARLNTQGKLRFRYGRISARIKTAAGGGAWPALWLLGTNIGSASWPACGEIDIMETAGNQPKYVYGTLHGPGYSGGQAIGGIYALNSATFGAAMSDDFHVYTIDWQKNSIKWFVDGELYQSATPKSVSPNKWAYNHDFFLIVNLAMGGTFGGEIDPDLQTSEMKVDWIKYYSLNGQGSFARK